jgi:hypothetical protein
MFGGTGRNIAKWNSRSFGGCFTPRELTLAILEISFSKHLLGLPSPIPPPVNQILRTFHSLHRREPFSIDTNMREIVSTDSTPRLFSNGPGATDRDFSPCFQ